MTATGLAPAGGAPAPRRGMRQRFAAAIDAFRRSEPAPVQLEHRSAATAPRRMMHRSAFKGAEVSRLVADWISSCLAPDLEIRGDMRLLRGRARELSRNNGHVGRYLELLKANVLGPNGIRCEPQVRLPNGDLDARANAAIADAWYRWADAPVSTDQLMNFAELSELALETAATDGEVFPRLVSDAGLNPFGLSLQLIDADLVDENVNSLPAGPINETRLGIEMDQWGRRLGYWIREQWMYQPGKPARTLQTYRLPASEVLHLYRPRRPNQTRGVTWIAAAMLPLQYLSGYTESELIAARTAAAKMGFVVNKDPSAAGSSAGDGELSTDSKTVEMEANPGSIEELEPGQEFQAWDPTHPTTAYADFVKAVLREVATALGVSYNSLANDLEGVNYSSMRHGLQAERDLWMMLQQWWSRRFLQPVYESWLNAAILTGMLRLPRADWRLYTAVRWAGRRWSYVNPKEDVETARLSLELGLTSRQRILAETTDADFTEIIEELEEENLTADAAHVSIDPVGAAVTAAGSPDATADQPAGDAGSGNAGKGSSGPNRMRAALSSSRNGSH